jgi:hypothetical protein
VRFDHPTLRKEREGWGTRRLVAGLEPKGALVWNQRLWWGFAHRFRPTYAGANMGHPYGAVGPAAGLRERPAVSHPAIVAGIEHKSAFATVHSNVPVIVLLGFRRDRCLRF